MPHSGATAAGSLYAVGGYDGEGVLAATERFDPAAGRWEVTPPNFGSPRKSQNLNDHELCSCMTFPWFGNLLV